MSTGKSLHIGLNFVDPAAYGGWNGQLSGCINDANSMQSIAQSLSYQTTLLTDGQATSHRVLQELSNASRQLQSGDIFFVSYSGHGGQVPDANSDEADAMDETWVLYDREIVDDELYSIWSQFAPGVRIIVVSDSCHSGTVTKAQFAQDTMAARQARRAREMPEQYAVREVGENPEDKPRAMPLEVQNYVNETARSMYDQVQYIAGPGRNASVGASMILISGCQDNQLSYDGSFNGAFTGKLLQVWNNGNFQGDYRSFHQAILNLMPPEQTPNYYVTGVPNPAFEGQKPFTIPQTDVVSPTIPTPTPRPTLQFGSQGPDVAYLQQRLQAWGYTVGVDSWFGQQTLNAVRQFQSNQGLVVDGNVGSNTWARLEQNPPAGTGTGTETGTGTGTGIGTGTGTETGTGTGTGIGTGTETGTGTGTGTTTGSRPTLRRGDTGEDVKYMQELLIMQGYFLTADSIFGPMTEAHVRDLQRSFGLSVDGVVGPQTWNALESF